MSISHRLAWPTDQTYGSRSGFILFAYVQRSYLLTGHKRVFCCECDLSNTSNYKHYAKRIQLNHLWAWDSVSDDHSLDDRLDKLSTQEFSDIWFGPMATYKGSYSDMGRELLLGVNKMTFYHDFVAMYHQRSSLVLGLIGENVCGLTTTCFVLTWNKGQDLIKLIEQNGSILLRKPYGVIAHHATDAYIMLIKVWQCRSGDEVFLLLGTINPPAYVQV